MYNGLLLVVLMDNGLLLGGLDVLWSITGGLDG